MHRSSKVAMAIGVACLPIAAVAGDDKASTPGVSVIREGSTEKSTGAAANFTGRAEVEGRFQREAPARIGGGTVTFAPGAHTAWHTHPLGQTLVVTRGHGYVQQWGQPAERFGAGDVVWIGPGVKHWHGAGPDEAMTHVALAESSNGRSVTWKELVSDAQYAEAVRNQAR
ncbi:cupin domain-containing protein [Novosphingobium sp. ZW T3_23]|uniref:(R)-mandelonitrile lyase n=1 Tax=Novosphingobium sp. ZW T3_23 TaxID=3378084 RepID=UPI003854D9AC